MANALQPQKHGYIMNHKDASRLKVLLSHMIGLISGVVKRCWQPGLVWANRFDGEKQPGHFHNLTTTTSSSSNPSRFGPICLQPSLWAGWAGEMGGRWGKKRWRLKSFAGQTPQTTMRGNFQESSWERDLCLGQSWDCLHHKSFGRTPVTASGVRWHWHTLSWEPHFSYIQSDGLVFPLEKENALQTWTFIESSGFGP